MPTQTSSFSQVLDGTTKTSDSFDPPVVGRCVGFTFSALGTFSGVLRVQISPDDGTTWVDWVVLDQADVVAIPPLPSLPWRATWAGVGDYTSGSATIRFHLGDLPGAPDGRLITKDRKLVGAGNPLPVSASVSMPALGTTADPAVTDPTNVTSAATLIALSKGWLTGLGQVADVAWASGSGSVIAILKAISGKFVNGAGTAAAAVRVTLASDGPGVAALGGVADAAVTDPTASGSLTALTKGALTDLGGVTETAPATDTASSGLNGRLQRIAQRVTSMIGLLPTALGQGTMAQSLRVVLPSDQSAVPQVGQGDVLDLTLTLDTSQYADGDVLADTQSLASAFRVSAGRAYLKGVQVLDEDDQGQPFDLIFLDANNSLGTENSAPNISDANARTIIGRLQVSSAAFYDIGGSRIAYVDAGMMLLKAAAASTTLYVGAISRGTGTYTASGIRLKVGLVWD